MKKTVLFFCVLLMAACQCGRTDFEARPVLKMPPLPDGETNRYRIMVRSDSAGTYTTTLRYDFLAPGSPDEEPLPVYALVLVTQMKTGNVPVVDSSLVYMHRSNLAPRSSFRFIRTGEAMRTTAANYSVHSVAVSSFGADEQKQQLFPTSVRTFDIDQVAFLGRALKFEPDKPIRITVVNPMGPPFGGAVHEARLKWAGDEEISVPAGDFDCRRVRLTMGGDEIDLWYEKAGTKRLVRYLTPGSGIAIELLPSAAPMLRVVPEE